MQKFIVVKMAAVCTTLVLCACASFGFFTAESPADNSLRLDHWFTLPQRNSLVVIGVSGRYTKPEMEIDAAREDAARKVAMYHGVHVVAETEQAVGSGFFNTHFASNVNIEYDQQIEKYMEKLTFDPKHDVISGDGVLFIRFTYPVAFPGSINYSPAKNQNGRPEWTAHPPQNGGNFMIGVGHSGRHVKVKDTVLKSYEAAAAALVSQVSTSIVTNEISKSGNYQNISVIVRRSEGDIYNFAVIETWMDPETLGVWTLAVAQLAH